MDNDYPAAHSMDTTWFAVDQAGHIGRFDSGEDGHVPQEAFDTGQVGFDPETGDATDVTVELWQLRHPGQPESAWWKLHGKKLANELGVFCYEYGEELIHIAPYHLSGAPRSPLHVDQLPPELRQLCKRIRFENVNFADAEMVQPAEQFRCTCWYEEARVAYLCSDGKTVRPIPGLEHRFADFCKQFRQEIPKMAKKLIFEGLTEGPKKPRRRRRKENDDGK
jgi:hypothetical protein